jgi:tetratricopeptide (TPR) repeat protein
MLAQAQVAFFQGDYETCDAIAEEAQRRVLAGERNWQVLDLVSLQGLLAHRRGEWFDRLRLELRRTRDQPEIANSVFDGYLCAAEYMLYGPTPYAEVIDIARGLRSTAERSGALRAVAFSAALIGEAASLSGDLELAEAELREAADLHHDLGSQGGEAHCLQRLAEVKLAQGEPEEARRLLEQAVPLARWSMIALHLMQRIFGTMISAEADPLEARALVDRAESTMGMDDSCTFCCIMLSVPAAIACARVGDLAHAQVHIEIAAQSELLWDGTSWTGAVDEAKAHLAMAEKRDDDARELFVSAATHFERAGQPIDAARCAASLAAV